MKKKTTNDANILLNDVLIKKMDESNGVILH